MDNSIGSRSEYDGGGVMPNTVYPKGSDALTPSDKLRLGYITGQENDSRAPVDPYIFRGGNMSDQLAEDRDRMAILLERQSRIQARSRIEAQRYQETRPRNY